MKKIILITAMLVFLLVTPELAQAYWDEGEDIYTVAQIQYYDPNTGEIVCWDACWHEVAHKLDRHNGMVLTIGERTSESDEFQDAVILFLFNEMNKPVDFTSLHPMTNQILLFDGFFVDWYIFPDDTGQWANYRWGGYGELYADILYWADGDIDKIPENLRQFYDMEVATQMYLDLK